MLAAAFQAAHELIDNSALERREQIERGSWSYLQPVVKLGMRISSQQLTTAIHLCNHIPLLNPPKNSSLQTAKAEIRCVSFHPGKRKANSVRISVRRELIDHGSARVTKAKKLGYFVEGFAGSIVTRLAKQAILKT